jgi:hypothetical protein
MNHCKDCRFWNVASEYIRKHRDNRKVKHGYCELTGGESFEPMIKKSLAFGIADRGDGAMLYCDEDFGCVQFEANP